MKNTKSLKTLLLFLCIAITAAVGAFCGFNLFASSASIYDTFAAEQAAPTPITLPDGITIGQVGYPQFTADDFEATLVSGTAGEVNAIYAYRLYTNNSVTITYKASGSYSYVVLTIDNGSPITFTGDNSYPIYLGDLETITKISITGYTASSPARSATFELVQTPDYYTDSSLVSCPFSWLNSEGKAVLAPINNTIMTDSISLTGLKGTAANPMFVDFYHNGNRFVVKCVDGVFTNNSNGNRLTEANGTLRFDTSGTYSVDIYDKTGLTGNPNANHQHFSFIIEKSSNGVDDVYIVATTSDGQTLSNTQPVNQSVKIGYYNIESNTVSSIDIVYGDINGLTHTEYHIPYSSDINDNDTEKSYNSFSADGHYHITINLRYPTSDGSRTYEFRFTIITEIYRSHTPVDNKQPTITSSLQANEIDTRQVTVQLDSKYSGFKEYTGNIGDDDNTRDMTSQNNVSYFVRLTNPAAGLSGATNNGSYTEPVSIKVAGVGDITVVVKKDNTSNTYILQKDQEVPGTDGIGKYSITITDEMGNTASLNFKISRALNSATYALIAAGVILLAVAILIIIKLRSRIKVR